MTATDDPGPPPGSLPWPGGSIGRLRARLHAVLGANLAPRQLFFATLAGAIIGCTPLYGLHLALSLLAARLFRLNPPAVYLAANISIPPTIPPLGYACVQVGERMLRGAFLPLSVADFRALAAGPGGVHALVLRFFIDWLAGGVLVGSALGLILGTAVYAAARARLRHVREGARPIDAALEAERPIDADLAAERSIDADVAAERSIDADLAAERSIDADVAAERSIDADVAAERSIDADLAAERSIDADVAAERSIDADVAAERPIDAALSSAHPSPAADAAIDAALEAASARYRAAPRRLRYYAHFKYRMDPCYRRLAELVPERSFTVDVGTGLGMLPVLLALLPGERCALGLDWDGDKLAAGRLAAAGLPRVELVAADARDAEIPACDVVALIDVLHYHDEPGQRALLARAAAALRPGGVLLVRDGDAARGGGAAITRGLEALAVRIGWNRGAGAPRFRPAGALATDLTALGLVVRVEPLAGRLHPGNVLLCAHRPA